MKTESSFSVPSTGLQCDSIEKVLTAAGSHVHDFYKVCREGKYFFLKALKPEFRSREYYREVLRKEFELGQQLHSEFIVSYHQLLDTPEECGVLMDYVNGLTLADFLTVHPEHFRQTANLRKFIQQMCLALQELHHHQALHLDLKPTNIMLTGVNNDVRLIDLGCSYMDARPHSIGQTAQYAAPEQTDGTSDVDARTDIFCLGKILQEIMKTSTVRSQRLSSIARRCLQEQKEKRYQTVDEILEAVTPRPSPLKYGLTTIGGGIFLIILSVLFYNQLTHHSIEDGQVFVDSTYQAPLFLQVVEADSQRVRVIHGPEGVATYAGDLVLPDSVVYQGRVFYITEIGDSAFFGCHELTNIKLPPTLLALRPHAFDDCRTLGSLHLPPSVTCVMMAAFINCRGLTHVGWPARITEVPRNCFVSCHSLRTITLPEGVTVIHQDAFCDFQQLQTIDLPESLRRIDRGAFYKCLSLERITLPANLQSLGEYLFYDCPRLQEITVLAMSPPTVSSIVTRDFQGVVRVPAAAINAYRRAPGWKHLRLEPLKP